MYHMTTTFLRFHSGYTLSKVMLSGQYKYRMTPFLLRKGDIGLPFVRHMLSPQCYMMIPSAFYMLKVPLVFYMATHRNTFESVGRKSITTDFLLRAHRHTH